MTPRRRRPSSGTAAPRSTPRSARSTAGRSAGSASTAASTAAPSAPPRARPSSGPCASRSSWACRSSGRIASSGADVVRRRRLAARVGPRGQGAERRIGRRADRARCWSGPAVSGPALLLGIADHVIMTDDAFAYVSGPDVVVAFTGVRHRARPPRRRRGARTPERRCDDAWWPTRTTRWSRSTALLVVPAVEPPRRSAASRTPTTPSTGLRPAPPRRCRRGRPRRTTSATVIDDVLDDALVPRAPRPLRAQPGHRPRPARRPPGRHRRQPADAAGRHARHRGVAQKAARFVQWCDCFNLPLVTFVDTPRLRAGQGPRVARHDPPRCASCVHAYAAATVPRLCVVLRKAYGGAYIVMDSTGLGNDWCIAWPTAEIAVMGAPPARCRSSTAGVCRPSTTRRSGRRSRPSSWPSTRTGSSTRTSPPSAATSTTCIAAVRHPPGARRRARRASAPSASSTADRRHSNTPL